MIELLLALADESDYDKIEYLAETFYDDLLVYATQLLQIRPIVGYEPQDAVQDTYVRVTLKIKCFDFTKTDVQIRKYMKQILNHIVADKREEARGSLLIEDLSIQIPSHDNFIHNIMMEYEKGAVVAALKTLDDRYRVPLTLRFRDEYSVKKIAELLNKPAKTVYTNIERGLVQLKARLEEGGWRNG